MKERIVGSSIYTLFLLLIMGLLYTQIIRYPHYARLSRNNSIRIIPIEGLRGTIYDRNNMPIVTNRLSFDVMVIAQELRDRMKLVMTLSEVTGLTKKEIMKSLEKAYARPFVPVTVIEDVDKEKALILEEASYDIRGLLIDTKSKRDYLYGPAASHVCGYVSEISEAELDLLDDYGYRPKDLIGRSGLERSYDTYLKGVDGGIQVEVDNKGRQTRTLGMREPQSGKDLFTTIDIEMQKVCDALLGDRPGAIVVMECASGQVLALASHPSFDPNFFVRPQESSKRLSLIRDTAEKPLIDRAISGLYPPGSVFKIVVASAALETKKISEKTTFACTGSFTLGPARFDCWKEGGHGAQDIVNALMNSCNVFFYTTGKVLGIDALEAYTKQFGFGRKTGIDIPDEARGTVPGRAWKRLFKKDKWYEGETINFAIGQGYLTVTPLQVLDMVTAMANGGHIVRPHLVTRIDGTEVASTHARAIGLSRRTIDTVRAGLFAVINKEGTGKRARVEGIAVAGKTGTAQNPRGRTHAWFCGFAPFSNPKLSLVVFLEHGGKGGLEPAEIAKGIFTAANEKGYL